MRSVARVLAATTTSLLIVGLVPGSALAALPTHVVSTSPVDGSRIAGPLTTISVTFDEETAGTLSVTPPPSSTGFTCASSSPPPPSTVVSCTPARNGGLLDGVYSVRVVASVATSPTPTPIDFTFTFTLDTTAPPAPTGFTLSPSPYNKASADAATPFTVSGTSENAGDSVAITLASSGAPGTVHSKTVTAGASGAFSTTFAPGAYPLVDGTVTATARSTDALGNVSTGSTGLATTTAAKDTVAPTAPTGVTINPAPYTKAHLTASSAIGVSGVAAAVGESVTVVLTSTGGAPTASATTTAGSGGAFGVSFAPSAVPDGTVTASATSTDAAGNTSAASTATTARDTVLPAVVSTSPVTTPTTGGSQTSQTNGTTNGFTVIADDTLGGSSSIVLKDASNTPITVVTSFPTTTSIKVVPTAPLAEGSYTATVTLVDDVGNTATPSTRSFTIDNTLPTAPSFTSLPVINVARAGSYTVTGTGEPGATVTVSFTDSTPVTPTVLTSTATVAGGGTWSVTRPVASLADGTVTLAASQADLAGNTSGQSAAGTTKDTVVPRVSAQAFSQDRYAAANPLLVTVTGKVDNGTTSDGEAVPSVTVTVTDGSGGSAAGIDSVVGSDGVFSVVINATALADGTLTAHVVASDAADNPSVEQTRTAIKDTGAPATPTVSVTNPVNSAGLLVVPTGTSEAGSTVTVTIDDAGNAGTAPVVGTGVTAGNGTYSVSPPMNLGGLVDGTLTVTARAADEAGNLSAIRTITVIKDTTGPVAPDVTFPTYVNIANVAAVPVTGTVETGATVVLLVTDSGSGSVTKTVTATGGSFSTTLDLSTLAQGDLTLTATPTDTRGNPGNPGTEPSTKDTVAPGTAAELSASPSPYDLAAATASSTLTATGKDAVGDRSASDLLADLTLSDTSGGTADVIKLDVPVAVTTGVFSWAFTKAQVLSQADGTLTVSVVLHDPAGNTSSVRQATLVKDVTELVVVSTTPADTSASQAVSDIVIATNEALVTGTSVGASPYSRISVTNGLESQVLGSIVFLADNKGMRFTPSSPFTEAGSPYTVTLHATDANDTDDTVDQVTTFSVDVTAPVAPTVSTVTDPVTNANKSAVSVTGNATEAGLTVTVTITGTSGTPVTKSATSTSGGAFTVSGINVGGLADGTLTVTAASKDAALNAGPSSAAVTTTKDATLPVVSSLAATASDFHHPSSSVTGQVSEAVAGSTVSLSATDGTHTVAGSATVLSDLSFAGTLDLTTMNAGQVTVTVTAVDVVGNSGTASVVTTRDTATPPGAPTGLAVVAGDRSATLVFTAPASNGGAGITSYTVVASPGGRTLTVAASPARMTGLTNGVTYTFTARATNRVGSGPSSAASNAVKPMGLSAVSLGALPGKVVSGTTIRLTGKLTRTDASVARQQVVVRARLDNGSTVTLARLTTSSTGAYAYAVKATYNRAYSVSYPGDAKNKASATSFRKVLAAARVTASAPQGSRTVNQVITGSVSPNKAGRTVTLYRVSSSGALVKLAATTLSSTSSYRFSVRLGAGYTTLRVVIGATPNNAAGSVTFRAYRT